MEKRDLASFEEGKLSDKLAGEVFQACLLGVKLFKHPYARNNHANEHQEAGYK